MREPLWNAEGILGRSEVKVFFFSWFSEGWEQRHKCVAVVICAGCAVNSKGK